MSDAAHYLINNGIAHGKFTTVRCHISLAARSDKEKVRYGFRWSHN